jgi:hypothetical protein
MTGPLPTSEGDVVIIHTPATHPRFLVWPVIKNGQQGSTDDVVSARPFATKPDAVEFAVSVVREGRRIYLLDQKSGDWNVDVVLAPSVRVLAGIAGTGDLFTLVVTPGPYDEGSEPVTSYGPMTEVDLREDLRNRGVSEDGIDSAIRRARVHARLTRIKAS